MQGRCKSEARTGCVPCRDGTLGAQGPEMQLKMCPCLSTQGNGHDPHPPDPLIAWVTINPHDMTSRNDVCLRLLTSTSPPFMHHSYSYVTCTICLLCFVSANSLYVIQFAST